MPSAVDPNEAAFPSDAAFPNEAAGPSYTVGTGQGSKPSGEPLIELIAIMDRLRSPGGCSWDAEQTHESLIEYLIEESYETIEAIETGDDVALVEELGDLLLQVVFHARIGQESQQPWNIDDVARGIADKLVRRHGHVFDEARVPGDASTIDAAGSERSWQAQKALEKGRTSVTDGVPMAMPSLVLAAKLLRRADRGDVDVPPTSPERADQAKALIDAAATQAEFGELLLALVAEGQQRGLDADAALRGSIRQFREGILASED